MEKHNAHKLNETWCRPSSELCKHSDDTLNCFNHACEVIILFYRNKTC